MNRDDLIKKFKMWKEPVPDDLKKASETISSKEFKSLTNETQQRIQSMNLWDIRNIGPKLALLLTQKGITRTNIMSHLAELPPNAQMHLIYNPLGQIPHDLIPKIAGEFMPDDDKDYTLAGSYRRNTATSGDIDILYWGDWEQLLERLKRHGDKWIVYSRGTETITGIYISKLATVQIDIWIAKPSDRHAMLLYTTGSKMFNIIMRLQAKKKGLKLNQHGLYKGNVLIPTSTEKDIFDAIGMRYLEPHERSR